MNVLDTSIWIDYLAQAKYVAYVEKPHYISSMCIAELIDVALRKGIDVDALLEFVKSKSIIVPVDVGIAKNASYAKQKYRTTANTFGLVDGIHLSTADKKNSMLITRDKDFLGIANVIVIKT
ncbi:MAG: PIN domain-containing protein [Candidatus Woesearchaeota archaeon]